jgi:nucleotide-binding universal stress UspA family protein
LRQLKVRPPFDLGQRRNRLARFTFTRETQTTPSRETQAMFKRLLIATDGSELAGKAVATGLALAKSLGAMVVAVTATEPWTAMMNGEGMAFDFPIEEYEKGCAEHAERILTGVRTDAGRHEVACETVHVTDFPAEAILATAKDKNCDLIVMASHGRRGISRLLLGSQATRVVTLSTVPVLVCR